MMTVIASDQRGNLLASTFCMEIATAFGLAMTALVWIAPAKGWSASGGSLIILQADAADGHFSPVTWGMNDISQT